MKLRTSVAAVILASLAVPAFAADYELRRVTVSNEGTADEYAIRCHFRPGVIDTITDVAGVHTTRSLAVTTDDARIQALVEGAPGIERPYVAGVTGHTDWWAKTAADERFKLIRTNVTTATGSQIFQDYSPAGQTLAVLVGVNCFRSFGQ